DFAWIPRDGDWMVVTALAADLAHAFDDAERAALLYELLVPFDQTNVVIGLGAVCLGATSRYLGRLALTLGRPHDAERHLRHAVTANAGLGAVVELAHSRVDLAGAPGAGARGRRAARTGRGGRRRAASGRGGAARGAGARAIRRQALTLIGALGH